jgi:hypothetical protein
VRFTISRRPPRRRHAAHGVGRVALVGLVTLLTVVSSPEPASAYWDGWYKGSAYFYAFDGLYERYESGQGNSQWIGNDFPDPSEGIDCSGYVDKVIALEDWTWPDQYYHSYSTWDWTGGLVAHSWQADTYNVVDPWAWLTTWVYDTPGIGDHMGVFQADNYNGSWLVFEARGYNYGVVSNTRYLSDLISWGYSRWSRENWDG